MRKSKESFLIRENLIIIVAEMIKYEKKSEKMEAIDTSVGAPKILFRLPSILS